MNQEPPDTLQAHSSFLRQRQEHWEQLHAANLPETGWYYHRWLRRTYRLVVPEGSSILEMGCGTGNLLASLKPSFGMGVDCSKSAIEQARKRHPKLHFSVSRADQLLFDGEERTFDYVILSDLMNDVWDVQKLLENVRLYCHASTRIVFNFYSHVWQYPLVLARKLGLARPLLTQNWLTVQDLRNLLQLSGLEPVKQWSEVLIPVALPGADLINRFPARILPFRWGCLTNFMVAKPIGLPRHSCPSLSIIVAARNEAGHIRDILRRIPDICPEQEVIFVEGGSSDGTWESIETAIAPLPADRYKLIKQPGKGKGDAVRAGFAIASGDILMILDADMTVSPEDLPRFYQAMVDGKGEFINGVRLVYPMQEQAMRFFNVLGNKFFAAAFSWLLGQPVRDTLCGTKVLWRSDYERIARQRHWFGHLDPFGDFDLLFGAARLNLKITEMPVRYHARIYGETNISRWSHGWLLLRMTLLAARRIKFS